MKKKGFIIVSILLIGALLLAGCGNQTASQPASQDQGQKKQIKVGALFSIPDPAHAGGWDQAQYAGLQVLKNKYGWDVQIAESVPYPKISEIASGYLDKGFDMIIFPDNGEIESFKSLPQKYPDKWMVMMSLVDKLPDAQKVAAWSPNMYSYGVTVGIAAAKTTKSGTIEVVGGMPIPALKDLFSGIIEGAKAVRPDIKVITYWAGDWMDVAKHKEITNMGIDKGADVVFTVTGPGTKGVYDAVSSHPGVKEIGYAADLYEYAPKAIMTSLLIDTPKMYTDMAEAYLSGKIEKKITDVGPEYFKFADFRGSVPADVEKAIRDAVAQYQKGELKVPRVIHDEITK